MPVKYLVNVPKNNLVFSLHVLRYTFGAHRSHVALQGKDKASEVYSQLQKEKEKHPHLAQEKHQLIYLGCYNKEQRSHTSYYWAFINFQMARILLWAKISPAI